jgi:hypothetical protein
VSAPHRPSSEAFTAPGGTTSTTTAVAGGARPESSTAPEGVTV